MIIDYCILNNIILLSTHSDSLPIPSYHQYTKRGRTMVHHYYTLKFSVQFPCSDDTVYLAHCYPFTYTDLQLYLAGESTRSAAWLIAPRT